MTVLTPTQIGQYASQAGFKGASLTTAIAVALAESGGDANATHSNSNGSVDRGLWQINSIHTQFNAISLFAPLYNAQAAFQISGGGSNWTPWTTFVTGAYLPYMTKAAAGALAATSGSGASSTPQKLTFPWLQYPFGLLYGQGDPGIGGEHGTDLLTPPNTPITFLLSGTITDISSPSWGRQVTWQLDNPGIAHNVPYAYQIHLNAVNPTLRKGMHVNAGDLMGWSGGAISVAQLKGTSNPTGSYFLDSPAMSSGPHTEFGLCYGPVYGTGAGFVSNVNAHPELNPMFLLQAAKNGQLTGNPTSPPPIASGGPGVPSFASLSSQVHETLINTPGFYGIALALDEAEQFPGWIDLTTPQTDLSIMGQDTGYAPPDVVGFGRSVGATLADNAMPFFIRSGLILMGSVLMLALIIKSVEGPVKSVAPLLLMAA